ncbi:hypothetical protein V2W45_1467600 [Cenococcum geophilum]
MLPPDDHLEQYRQYAEQYQQYLFDNRAHNYTYTPRAGSVSAPNHDQPYQGGYYNYPYQYAYGYQYSAQSASPIHGQYYSYYPYYPYYPTQTLNYGYNHAFYGCTREAVEEGNRLIAAREGVYQATSIQPHDPKPDQRFWVKEVNGDWTLRSYYAIKNDLRPGKWMMDAVRGALVFATSHQISTCSCWLTQVNSSFLIIHYLSLLN